MQELDYPDLPAWAQPGQKAARIANSGTEMVTVTRVTKTQIVTLDSHSHEHRFERTPRPPDARNAGFVDVRFRERGQYWTDLCNPDEPRAHADLLRAALMASVRSAWRVSEDAARKVSRGEAKIPGGNGELEQWAVEQLDALENAVRTARCKVEKAAERHRERASLYRR